MALKREDEWILHAGVIGVNIPAVYSWSEMDGGEVEAQNTKVRPGGMLPEQDLGGPTTRTDATIKRPYSTALHPYIVQLENVSGRAAMWISYTPLDANGQPDGPPVTIHGTLKAVVPPPKNANNSGAAFFSLVMGCHVEASVGS